MIRLLLLSILFPLPATAADSADGSHWFVAIVFFLFFLYTLFKLPTWIRNAIREQVEKHEKYVAWIRDQSEFAKSLGDDEVRELIEGGVTFKFRVMLALLPILVVVLGEAYPHYANFFLGPSPPYLNEVFVAVIGGCVIAGPFVLISGISLRLRIKWLLNKLERNAS